ncbi:hypothetical protein HNQ07_004097 [Deinococcus metalli]|uniref:Uncharacterized protein n=1 Tax=Deinococcus metalli TaxID=1141878 RepID=A0A7W8NS59_9DEIO|nr:hypothetical protein [Deinococcus metalli]MBB5378590.1 hypothetical protein [Deinococcus metalli]GHF60996.1 hypothetical protein GCM10017781_41400 [Deinococcus metalli]
MTRVLTALLLALAEALAAEDRKDRVQEWRDECAEVKQPVLHALQFVWSALTTHPPFDASAHELHRPSADDVNSLNGLRRALTLLIVALLVLGLTLSLDGVSQDDLLWMLRTVVPVGVAVAGSRTGFGHDVPWLRATRMGSGLMLAFVFLTPLVILLLHAWSLVGVTWFTFAVLLMVWDSYWSVRRPLRRRGLLGR